MHRRTVVIGRDASHIVKPDRPRRPPDAPSLAVSRSYAKGHHAWMRQQKKVGSGEAGSFQRADLRLLDCRQGWPTPAPKSGSRTVRSVMKPSGDAEAYGITWRRASSGRSARDDSSAQRAAVAVESTGTRSGGDPVIIYRAFGWNRPWKGRGSTQDRIRPKSQPGREFTFFDRGYRLANLLR